MRGTTGGPRGAADLAVVFMAVEDPVDFPAVGGCVFELEVGRLVGVVASIVRCSLSRAIGYGSE